MKGKKLILIILGGVIYSYVYLPYNSNFRYLEIKSLVHRNLNLRVPVGRIENSTSPSYMVILDSTYIRYPVFSGVAVENISEFVNKWKITPKSKG